MAVSREMYQRIYRLGLKKVDPRKIAVALNVPLRTVQTMLYRFFATTESDPGFDSSTDREGASVEKKNANPLNVFLFPKTRYVIVDLGGALSNANAEVLREELEKARNTEFKALGLLMSDVSVLEEKAISVLLDFKKARSEEGRFVGLLDPNPDIEPMISQCELDREIAIFGTEHAFEDAAFKQSSFSAQNKKVR